MIRRLPPTAGALDEPGGDLPGLDLDVGPSAPVQRPAGIRRPAALVPSRRVPRDVGSETLRLGRLTLRHCPSAVVDAVRALLNQRTDLHLYETYHLVYPSGTRILTLSRRAPLGLIYRELAPALIRSAPVASPAPVPLPKVACA